MPPEVAAYAVVTTCEVLFWLTGSPMVLPYAFNSPIVAGVRCQRACIGGNPFGW